MTMPIMKVVKRKKDAVAAVCRECSFIVDAPGMLWCFSKSKAMHERFSGHKVDYVTYDIEKTIKVIGKKNLLDAAHALVEKSAIDCELNKGEK